MAGVDLPADLPDRELSDRSRSDREVPDRELSDRELSDRELSDVELSDSELADLEMSAVPRVFPLELPVTSKRDVLARARQIGTVVSRHFAPLVLRKGLRRTLPPDAYARPLRRTFEDLGATFMKFGQLIGSSPGVFGESVAEEFRSCLDTGPLVPFDEVRRIVERDLGMPLDEAFGASPRHRSAGPRSRSCTRRRRTTGVGSRSRSCGRASSTASRPTSTCSSRCSSSIAKQTGEYAAGQLLPMFQGFRAQLGEELDLRNEARSIAHYRWLLDQVQLRRVTVPEVFPELSGRRVLTMEFLDGVPVDDLTTRRRSTATTPLPSCRR